MARQRKGAKARDTSLADAICEDLMTKILAGQLPPGQRLRSERDLAVDYDTNRNTLREAIRKLEQAGLVSVRHGAGVSVTNWRRDGHISLLAHFVRLAADPMERVRVLVDLLLARMQVLEMAVALAAQRGDADDLARIDDLCERQVRAFEAQDRATLVQGDIALVNALVDAADSLTVRWIANTVIEVYRNLLEGQKALWIFEPTFPSYLRELSAAISGRDAQRAVALTRDYYGRCDAKLLAMLEQLMPRLASEENSDGQSTAS